ncbi:MAG: ankyrin repeat domain-containing protein, partial [Treponema sp.]|nr:ankyrin repeat domain-containing protein [Treponema sp.]
EKAVKQSPAIFSSCFKLLLTEDDLSNYLKSEYEVCKKKDLERGAAIARETLLNMGVPVNEKSMAHCVDDGLLRELTLFLAAGFSPDTKSNTGVPLLSISARKGNNEILRYLLLAGAQVNLTADDRGSSALIDSVMGKHQELVKDLIAAGADVNIRSKDGQSALIVAVGADEEAIVEMLLKAGADPDISDAMGVSARKYATLFHKSAIMALFDTITPNVPRETA